MSFKKQWAMLAVVGRPCVKQSLGVLLVLSATLWAVGMAEAQLVLDFDTSGPTSTDDIPDFFDLLGFEPDLDTNWTIDPNTVNPDNGSNALHTISNGNQLEAWFSRAAILKPDVFLGEDVEISADITWDDNDNAGLYVRFTGESDVPLENEFYHVRVGVDNGPPSSVTIYKVTGGSQEQLAQRIDDPVPVSQGDTHNLRMKAQTVGNTVEISVWLNDEPVTGMNPFVDDNNPILGSSRVGVGQETNPSYFDNIAIIGTSTVGTPGDFNGDGNVDLADFNILTSNFSESFSLAESFSKGDNNLDRMVDLLDFIEFREIFNNQGQGVAGVPEPSGMALAGLALLATIAVMKRKKR